MRIIDSHIHIGKKTFCNVKNSDFNFDLCSTYEEVLKLMDANGIEKTVILPIPHRDYNIELTNNYVMEAHRKSPERLLPFCRIDEHLEENLRNGFMGVKLHLLYEDVEIKGIKKELQIIEDACVPLIVHAKFSNKPKQVEKILKYAPNINLILAHMGRGHLYTSEQVIENALALKKYPNVYMDLSTVGDISAIINVCEIIGYDRVLYASDYPFGKSYYKDKYDYSSELLSLIKNFPEDKKEFVFFKNAERLICQNKDIIIRRAKKDDVDVIMNIFKSISPEEQKFLAYNSKSSLIRQTIRRELHCYVAVIDGNIVGFMRESGRPDGFSLLEEIVVDINHRGKGIASRLLEYYHRAFSKNMAKTNASNQKMIYLLKKNGYVAENPNSPRIINWVRNKG